MLRLASHLEDRGEASCRVESPVPGVVLIDVSLGGAGFPAPLHWRAGDWTKPPLDVSLTPDGRVVGFQFVLQDERVPEEDVTAQRQVKWAGTPVFVVDGWPTDRYCDERLVVSPVRSLTGELVLRLGGAGPALEWGEVSAGLLFGFAGDQLVEIVVGALDTDDWASVGAFSLGS